MGKSVLEIFTKISWLAEKKLVNFLYGKTCQLKRTYSMAGNRSSTSEFRLYWAGDFFFSNFDALALRSFNNL